MEFQNNIKEWVSIDNQEKKYKSEVKLIREKKNYLSDKIFSYAENNNLNHAVIEISDGRLKFQNTKVSTPLTFKFVEKCLVEKLQNEEQAKDIIKYIKESRESKYVSEIRRTYNKIEK